MYRNAGQSKFSTRPFNFFEKFIIKKACILSGCLTADAAEHS